MRTGAVVSVTVTKPDLEVSHVRPTAKAMPGQVGYEEQKAQTTGQRLVIFEKCGVAPKKYPVEFRVVKMHDLR